MSRCIADCLNVGSNLVTIALVAGEVDELKRALALAPRSQRADWITRVSVSCNDDYVSLVWIFLCEYLEMKFSLFCFSRSNSRASFAIWFAHTLRNVPYLLETERPVSAPQVQIHDSVISPFYWAVRDGKLDMARLMIQARI